METVQAGGQSASIGRSDDPMNMEVFDSLFGESFGQINAAGLAYDFYQIIDLVQKKELSLTIPEEFPEKNMERFLTEDMDLTAYHNGNGISLYDMKIFVDENKEALAKAAETGAIQDVVEKFYVAIDKISASDNESFKLFLNSALKGMFLSYYRSIDQKVTCVYSIIKDTIFKRITVAFRGSMSKVAFITGTNRDWRVNFQPGMIRMNTPENFKRTLKGIHVLVRRGFYEYLFDNPMKEEGTPQIYDNIRKEIQILLKGETGYKLYVTGHSLGGALATLFSFKLAGESEDMLGTENVPIPKPVSCITWAAPFTGSDEFRIAHEQLEHEGLLRSLRYTNWDDPIPTFPPISSYNFFTPLVHVGINIRLTSSDYIIEHSSRKNLFTYIRNGMWKPVWKMMKAQSPHSLSLYQERFNAHTEKFQALKIDNLYKDDTIVSKNFIGLQSEIDLGLVIA